MAEGRASYGERDRYITIQSLTEGIAESRLPTETWNDLGQVWAKKEDLGGRERVVANQVSAPYDTKWQIPYFAAMDPELVDVRKSRRLVVMGRVHDIVAAEEVGRKAAITVYTLAGGLAQ